MSNARQCLPSRREAISGATAALAATTALVRNSTAAVPAEIRVGYQKSSILAVVRQQGLLERRFATARIRWVEFPFGPPLLEAMNADRIDYGYTGNAPPIFAQAARENFVYVGALPGRGDNVSILVHDDCPLRAIADLQGHNVAVGKGSSGHAFLVAALEGASVDYRAVQPIYLAPADAAAAFARGSVDVRDIIHALFDRSHILRSLAKQPIEKLEAVLRRCVFPRPQRVVRLKSNCRQGRSD